MERQKEIKYCTVGSIWLKLHLDLPGQRITRCITCSSIIISASWADRHSYKSCCSTRSTNWWSCNSWVGAQWTHNAYSSSRILSSWTLYTCLLWGKVTQGTRCSSSRTQDTLSKDNCRTSSTVISELSTVLICVPTAFALSSSWIANIEITYQLTTAVTHTFWTREKPEALPWQKSWAVSFAISKEYPRTEWVIFTR